MFQKSSNLQAAAAACVKALSPRVTASAQESTDDTVDEVVVRAHPLSAENLAQPTGTLAGQELERSLSTSLAETLRDMPGVHNASFGQAVGRPVVGGGGGAPAAPPRHHNQTNEQ